MKRNRYVRPVRDVEGLCAMAVSIVGVIVSLTLVGLFVNEALKGVLQ